MRRRAPRPAAAARPCAVLLASEGRAFSEEAIRHAADIARRLDGEVRVLTLARIWGTAFGLPHPGLRPHQRELERHQEDVAVAIRALKRRGVGADGHIIATRKATRSILAEAERIGCEAIVMAGDRPRGRFAGDFMWSQEPQRVSRRAQVPVHIVPATAT
jgi:nucleotide-binding universal stress UspA family protein